MKGVAYVQYKTHPTLTCFATCGFVGGSAALGCLEFGAQRLALHPLVCGALLFPKAHKNLIEETHASRHLDSTYPGFSQQILRPKLSTLYGSCRHVKRAILTQDPAHELLQMQ